MSITQTYYLAHSAHQKLSREASRADHDLRVLVGHANLLDCLMLELADAEQEQERWFNQTVTGASKASYEQSRHIQWAETVVEDPEEDDDWDIDYVSDVDSEDSDDLGEEEFAVNTPVPGPVRTRAPSPMLRVTQQELDDDADSDESDFEYDDMEDLEELALTRSASRQSPPELLSDSDGESEEDTMPPSPPQQTLDSFDEKESQSKELPLSDTEQPGLLDQGYYISHRQQGTLIPSY